MEPAHFMLPDHPAAFDFRGWLAGRTPPGAPTLVVNAPGSRGPLQLPQVRSPALSPPRGRARRGAAPALHAACLVDVEGLTPREVSAQLALTGDRSGRQHAREGRFLAAELGLWPWTVVGGRSLHRAWWTDARFAHALHAWAVELRPPEVEPAARRLSAPRRAPTARLPIA